MGDPISERHDTFRTMNPELFDGTVTRRNKLSAALNIRWQAYTNLKLDQKPPTFEEFAIELESKLDIARKALLVVAADIAAINDDWLADQSSGLQAVVKNIREQSKAALEIIK